MRHETRKGQILNAKTLQQIIEVRLFERAWIILDDDRLAGTRLHNV